MKRKRLFVHGRLTCPIIIISICIVITSLPLTEASEDTYSHYLTTTSEINRLIFHDSQYSKNNKKSTEGEFELDIKEKEAERNGGTFEPIELKNEEVLSDANQIFDEKSIIRNEKNTFETTGSSRVFPDDIISDQILDQASTEQLSRHGLLTSDTTQKDFFTRISISDESLAVSEEYSTDQQEKSHMGLPMENDNLIVRRDVTEENGSPASNTIASFISSSHSSISILTSSPSASIGSIISSSHGIMSELPSGVTFYNQIIASPRITPMNTVNFYERNIVFAGPNNASLTSTSMNAVSGSNISNNTYSLDIPNDNGNELNYLYLIFLILGVIIIAFLVRRYVVKNRRAKMQRRASMLRAGALRMDLERARGSSTRLSQNESSINREPEMTERFDSEDDPRMPPPSYPEAAHLKDNYLPVYHEVNGEGSEDRAGSSTIAR